MTTATIRAYDDLAFASRLRARTANNARIAYSQAVVLMLAGALAALVVAFVPLPLRIPGHAILKVAVPIVCGVATVPRPFAGSMAGIWVAVVICVLEASGIRHVPTAALVAALAIGPAIDLAVVGFRGMRLSVYLRFAIAGLLANLLAFFVRWGTSSLGFDAGQLHRMSEIGVVAFISFALCGILAGIVSAMIFFRNGGEASEEELAS